MAGKRRGRPEITFGREHLDAAKAMLGRAVFASRAAGRLAEKFGIGRDAAYKLLDQARDEVNKGLMEAGGPGDPASAAALFLMTVMSNRRVAVRDQVQAAMALTRLLSTSRRMEAASGDTVEGFLAALLTRQLARPQPTPATPTDGGKS